MGLAIRIGQAALVAILVAGCAGPRFGLDACPQRCAPQPAGEETVLSLRYRVHTDAGRAAAMEVDRFMERAAALWTPLFGVPEPAALPLDVYLHCDPADLEQVLASQKLTARATGLYLPAPIPAIHVACFGEEPGHPYRTLLHEGTEIEYDRPIFAGDVLTAKSQLKSITTREGKSGVRVIYTIEQAFYDQQGKRVCALLLRTSEKAE